MCWKHGKVTERPCFAEAFAEAVSNVSKAIPQTSQNFEGLNIHDKIGDGVLLYCCFTNMALFAGPQPGNALMRQGAWVEAIGFFDAALNLLRNNASRPELNERQRSCWMHMAFCHLNLEEYQAAIQYLDFFEVFLMVYTTFLVKWWVIFWVFYIMLQYTTLVHDLLKRFSLG